MNGMVEREKALENKFAHDEELKFKAHARRNKLVGLWAAHLMARTDAAAYARGLVAADALDVDDANILRTLRQDFAEAKIKISEEKLIAKLAELHAEAARQVFEE